MYSRKECILSHSICSCICLLVDDNQEHFSFLMPVVKALIEKLSDMLSLSSYVPDLPLTHSGPVFYEDFQKFCQNIQWSSFIEKKVRKCALKVCKVLVLLLVCGLF